MNGTGIVRRLWMFFIHLFGARIDIHYPIRADDLVRDLLKSQALRAQVEHEKNRDNAEIDRLTRRRVARDQTDAYRIPLADSSDHGARPGDSALH